MVPWSLPVVTRGYRDGRRCGWSTTVRLLLSCSITHVSVGSRRPASPEARPCGREIAETVEIIGTLPGTLGVFQLTDRAVPPLAGPRGIFPIHKTKMFQS